MMRSSRSVLLSPSARWTTRRCWSGCGRTVSDPLLTQNPKKAGRSGRKQWKTYRTNGGKKHKSEPKRLRFSLETTYGPEGRGFESLTACQNPRNRLISRIFAISARRRHVSMTYPPVNAGHLCGVPSPAPGAPASYPARHHSRQAICLLQ